jgi:hypothetical protein
MAPAVIFVSSRDEVDGGPSDENARHIDRVPPGGEKEGEARHDVKHP